MQKRGDYTFLLDLVKTMDIQISNLRHWNCEPLHMRTSTYARRFFIKSSFLQRNCRISRIFGCVLLSELEKPRRRRRQNKKRTAGRNTERAKQNTHGNCTPYFLADSFVIKARLHDNVVRLAIRSTKCPERLSRV